MNNTYHIPVLLSETIDMLAIQPNGIYVDCTFGGGGHSAAILKHLNAEGRLFAFDQDADAFQNFPHDARMVFVPENFRHIQRFLKLHGVFQVDGILADLGVSSHQFNEASRGFSIRFDGPLDMRMDGRSELTAEKIIATYSEHQLHKLFEKYGEVTNAKTLAKHIVQYRQHTSVSNVAQFKAALAEMVKGNPNKYFAQVFQALRIEVNDELGALNDLLLQLPTILKTSGRAAFITFHSLEDRLVKNYFKGTTVEDENPFISTPKKQEFELISKKPIVPSESEIKMNSRSRSAKLRVAEKL
ncbi:MAG: 16S rRNA (cytosine(1402)-N(4))-methyltransferase RsmH [Hydrotalea flava]|uniref:16S rRNA (cytosine(1402)-N(4))-methyltransferase RsmH n=1 Tax=Hydrotalea TaxID=1004300 RepID=UPI000943F774|nr:MULTISPECIES: 16S rRNA (cytosine(1402)-N(4))-methyltransferase RsmH [Hydrotalea]MBY0348855.1 16S rRNA (cytosine(1402)-N(4))-methyltransferase RsmH [Hydrotalea flava]NIM33941.1 16S rRNA (cytosine(1402)-N(4))-methyltransferase RsmH [Hydrotalea flava]NIM36770.1 16S rRNA (cytosine(1402)-N(4))-methyltransferase RsmH [Hydrotalea flava]NIN01955.1 16S rRNA (cytosine(1402)-N(4))-methyltransferase RsmH [Hydrotalea flava]NIN13614.1 16S rRNA (cytosine(1402)-N(4))-methyltransferase RsmH [Hydrotalea flav